MHPALMGPALLHYLRQGKPVENVTVIFTHADLHRIFHDQREGTPIRKRFPLEITIKDEMLDCRGFEAPWHIDIRTDEQKQEANRKKAEPTPKATPPEETDPKVGAVIAELFSPFYDQAIREYQQLERQQQHELIRQAIRRRQAQAQSEDTAHGE